jgi:hypothetical protein
MNDNALEVPTEFLQVWNVLDRSYPRFCQEQGAENMLQTLRLYYQLLSDLPIEQIKAAVLRHVSCSKWFPTVAELREASTVLSAAPLPSAIEAWGEVLDAMAGIEGYCFADHVTVPRFANPITARLVDAMGWRALCGSENGIADRARFIESYEQLAARNEREQRLPAQLQAGAHAPSQLVANVAARLTAHTQGV